MQVNRGKLQILTVAAMLVLISGGIAAYAQGQSASPTAAPSGAVPVALAGGDTSSTTNSTSTTANRTLCQPTTPVNVGRLILPITATGLNGSASSSIAFNGRGCFASITSVGGIFNVQVLLRFAKPVTQYSVVLVANGTSYTLGNMVTGPAGNGQMDNQVLLKPGTYVVSIRIYDTSSNPGQSTLVLQTAQGTIVSPPFPTVDSGQHSNQTSSGQGQGQGGPGQGGHGGPGQGQGGPGGQGQGGQSRNHK